MKNLNLDLLSLLLISLVVKSLVDGGSFPIAIAVVAILANQGYKAFLANKVDQRSEAQEARLKLIEEELGSVKSKLALTLGSNRLK
jgi:hypothetical protein